MGFINIGNYAPGGNITYAGLILYTVVALTTVLLSAILVAVGFGMSGREFPVNFYKFLAVLYVLGLLILVLGAVRLPCNLNVVPTIPTSWQNGCPTVPLNNLSQ